MKTHWRPESPAAVVAVCAVAYYENLGRFPTRARLDARCWAVKEGSCTFIPGWPAPREPVHVIVHADGEVLDLGEVVTMTDPQSEPIWAEFRVPRASETTGRIRVDFLENEPPS